MSAWWKRKDEMRRLEGVICLLVGVLAACVVDSGHGWLEWVLTTLILCGGVAFGVTL
jgi:hypothetical protein